jgi:SAM-dependent MidA family methyltransferase
MDGTSLPRARTVRELIDQRLFDVGKITFAEFMWLSLYSPPGFYSTSVEIGDEGSFSTSPTTSPAHGAVMAHKAVEIWHALGKPSDFQIIEDAAGNGSIARPLLLRLGDLEPQLHRLVRYSVVDASPKHRALLRDIPAVHAVVDSALAPWPEKVTGLFFSNEFVDAIPVHRIKNVSGKPVEVYVSHGPFGSLVEVPGPVSGAIDNPYHLGVLDGVPD